MISKCKVKKCDREIFRIKHKLCRTHYNQLQKGNFKSEPIRVYRELKAK